VSRNAAAINYPFGSVDALYTAVIVLEAAILRRVARGLLGPVPGPDSVDRLALSLLATSQWLLVFDRDLLGTMFPRAGIDAAHVDSLTEHLVAYSFGGAEALRGAVGQPTP
jgi:hypothetical protein